YNIAALLCYLPTCLCCVNLVPCVLWLATEPKENRFLRFHALQGLILFGLYVVVYIILRLLGAVINAGASVTDSGMAFLGGNLILLVINIIFLVGFLIVHIIAMVKANQMQIWKLPII